MFNREILMLYQMGKILFKHKLISSFSHGDFCFLMLKSQSKFYALYTCVFVQSGDATLPYYSLLPGLIGSLYYEIGTLQ